MKIRDRRTGRDDFHAYVQSVDANHDGKYVMRYIIGLENYQGFQFSFDIRDNDEFNTMFEVYDEEPGKTAGWLAREAEFAREHGVEDPEIAELRKASKWMIKMSGLYGGLDNSCWWRALGDCFDFVWKQDLGTVFDDLEKVRSILIYKDAYLKQYAAKKMEIVPVG